MKNNLHEKPYSTTFEVDPAFALQKSAAPQEGSAPAPAPKEKMGILGLEPRTSCV